MLLKPPVRFSRPAQLYFGLEQAYLVSFTSSVMLGSSCLTSRFQGLARNFLFCSLLDENRSYIFSLRVDSRMLPTPISFCPPVSTYVFDILYTSLTPLPFCPWNSSSFCQQLSWEGKESICFQCLSASFWACATTEYIFPQK